MVKRFPLLVFDWDGTLMDSAAAIVASIQAACSDVGLAVPEEGRARHVIGLGLAEALAHVLPGEHPAVHAAVVERYRYHYLSRDHDIPLFPGAAEMVQDLHQAGFLLAVATGKSRRGLDRALAHTGLAQFFHATRCADEGFSKPHPGMLLAILDELGVEAQSALMIGDTTHDLQMAQNARVAALGAAYGAHPRENLAALAPLACVDSFDELCRWLATNA